MLNFIILEAKSEKISPCSLTNTLVCFATAKRGQTSVQTQGEGNLLNNMVSFNDLADRAVVLTVH